MSGNKAIRHEIGDRVELWQSNHTSMQLFHYILAREEAGYSFNWTAALYCRRYFNLRLTEHRQDLTCEALKMLNEYIARKMQEINNG